MSPLLFPPTIEGTGRARASEGARGAPPTRYFDRLKSAGIATSPVEAEVEADSTSLSDRKSMFILMQRTSRRQILWFNPAYSEEIE